MPVVLLTSGSGNTVIPGDFVAAGHKVYLFGPGGAGAAGTIATTPAGGAGGGGGACTTLTYSSGTIAAGTSVAFLISAAGTGATGAAQWQSSTLNTGAFYEALGGGNAATTTAGAASGSTTTVGSPTIVYTAVNHTGAAGGASASSVGGGGGGGSGGLTANGGGGATPTSTGGGGGGGGGAVNAGTNSGSATGGNGGNGSSGAGGTGNASGGTAPPGTGSSGGAGGTGAVTNVGGLGGSGTDVSADHYAPCGCGGGGGGGGTKTTTGAATSTGGNGGKFGGGAGGGGGIRTTGPSTAGTAGSGAIAIVYTSTLWGWDYQSNRIELPQNRKLKTLSALKAKSGFSYPGRFQPWFEPTRSQEPRRRRENAGALRHRHGFAAPGAPPAPAPAWQFDIQQQPTIPRWKRAGALVPEWRDNIESPFQQWRNFGWEETAAQPRHKFWKSPDIGDTGTEAPFVPTVAATPPWGFEFYYSHRRPAKAMSALKGRSEFAYNTIWPNWGWEPTWAQPIHRLFKSPATSDAGIVFPFVPTVAAAPSWGFDIQQQPTIPRWKRYGAIVPEWRTVEPPFTQWLNWGWEPTASQPPHHWWRGQGLRGDDGTQAPFVSWVNAGWEIQPPQPPHRWYRGQGLRGEDGTELPFSQWFNFGWEETASQPRHKFWKSPDIGDFGIELPFGPTVAPVAWPFDPTFSQEPRRRWERMAALMRGPDGTESPFVNWRNWGWEETASQPLHKIWKSPTTGDSGTEAQFINWLNFGWEQAASQPRHPFWKSPDIGNAGIVFPFVPSVVTTPNWGFEVPWLSQRHFNRGAGIDGLSQFGFFDNWVNWGWEERQLQPLRPLQQRSAAGLRHRHGFAVPPFVAPPAAPAWGWEIYPPQPRIALNKRAPGLRGRSEFAYNTIWPNWGWEPTWAQPKHPLFRSPDVGHAGIVFPFVPTVAVTPSWGFEQLWQPLHRWYRGQGLRGPDGTDAPFVQWRNWGWEQTQSQPLHKLWKSPDIGDSGIESGFVNWLNYGWESTRSQEPHRWYRGQGLRGIDGIESPFVQWFNSGWEPTRSQEPRRRWERIAALLRGDDGTESPFSQWRNWGWEQSYSQPLHKIWKSPDIGDSGIEFIFTALTVPISAWGFDETFSQEPRRRWERAAALMRGPDGTDFRFSQWVNAGWAQILSQEPRRRWEKIAALLRGPDGTDNLFTQWSNSGWEPTISQPPHRIWKSPTTGDTGTEAQFIQWLNTGWEVQPWQPPFAPKPLRGAIMRGIGGDEFPYVFVPSLGASWGFEVQPWQPPAFLRPRRGTLLRGDDGTYSTLIRWFNAGWEVQPWQPPRRPWERRGAVLKGDEGTEARYIRWLNAGWEVQPPQPPRWPRTRRGALLKGEDGTEAKYTFVQFVQQLGEVNLPILRRWPKTGRGAILRGDEGFYHPFVPSIIPIPVLRPRRLTGKVFIIDAVPSMTDRPLYLFGPLPKVNESCTLLFYVGGGLPVIPAPVLFTFTRPDGVVQNGDVPFAFIGTPTVRQIMIPNFPSGQYLVYQFGLGELSMAGTWKVSAITAGFFSNTYSFNVLPF